ncbi:hypothetical protein D0Z07_8430 [Hyphodiscus hymeniophilus]|uniref:Uncharacterized protein n=1 Tax=Hyphodiscus hymeniophilus TaxID=353542 RepID=A0A9P6SLI2_9HELO|nr:hypothetical protein D0Z07_8430 [Hyphodiscus hymeniophilus]
MASKDCKSSLPTLPPELILSVIGFVISPTESRAVALRASHLVTKTLVSLLRALRLLHARCLYIDSDARLMSLAASIAQMPHELRTASERLRLMRQSVGVSHILSLYLSYTEVNDFQLAQSVLGLFTAIAPYLRRLVIDMPLRDYDYWDLRMTTASTLREAFSKLTGLDTVCSIRDELFLPGFEPTISVEQTSVWPLWPNLKTLILYNEDIDNEDLWPSLGKLEHFETLVLTRCDGLEETDIKLEWTKNCGQRPLEVLIVNIEGGHRNPLGRKSWKEDSVVVKEMNVPTSYYGDEDEIELCQEWVKRRVLRGVKPADWDSVEW